MNNTGDAEFRDDIDKLIRTHQRAAQQYFLYFKNSVLDTLKESLETIETEMKKQMSLVCKKLEDKIRDRYKFKSFKVEINFQLEPYVTKQIKNLRDSISNLRTKIFDYINNFNTSLLENNIQKFKEMSLFHSQNHIKHVNNEWYSVTSRKPLERAQISVTGLSRPETSWLALGVSKRRKQYGPIKNTINNEQFLGNIYLNGSENPQLSHNLKKDLKDSDVFVIEHESRMIYVYRKHRGRNNEEAFILDDNTDYFFYIAMKGPLTVDFAGE